jgi:hypothetical protein
MRNTLHIKTNFVQIFIKLPETDVVCVFSMKIKKFGFRHIRVNYNLQQREYMLMWLLKWCCHGFIPTASITLFVERPMCDLS